MGGSNCTVSQRSLQLVLTISQHLHGYLRFRFHIHCPLVNCFLQQNFCFASRCTFERLRRLTACFGTATTIINTALVHTKYRSCFAISKILHLPIKRQTLLDGIRMPRAAPVVLMCEIALSYTDVTIKAPYFGTAVRWVNQTSDILIDVEGQVAGPQRT